MHESEQDEIPRKQDDVIEPRSEGEGESGQPKYVVCVGASAGGLEPVQQYFGAMPNDTGAAFVLVLHLSPDFKSMMPELLAKHTTMPVATVEQDTVLTPNAIHLIPPRKNMVISGNRLRLTGQDRAPGRPVNSPIDIFLQSLAEGRGPDGIGVILSGTGSDGSRGIESLKDAGGFVLVQDPVSAKFDGMPVSAILTRIVDHCAEPKELASITADLVLRRMPRVEKLADEPGRVDDQALAVVETLRHVTSVDYRYCRESMLMRRVRRRMALLGSTTVTDYIDHLNMDSEEVRRLGEDLLIGVTSFFRDPLAFEALKRHLSRHIASRTLTDPFRVWVPACSTGQEAYTIAMLLTEAMEATGRQLQVKIFATDLDQNSLAIASAATYSATAMQDMSSARLAQYFIPSDGAFKVRQSLRDMVIFARQDIVADPPFTKIDLVSCRNFLIYAKTPAQEHVLSKLHFALRVGGTLFLGSGESLGKLESEFETRNLSAKVFQKTREANLHLSRARFGPASRSSLLRVSEAKRAGGETAGVLRSVAEALAAVDNRTVALLDGDGTLLDVIDDPLKVFRVSKGNPTTDTMRLVGEHVATAIATGLHRLRAGETEVRYAVIVDESDEAERLDVRLRTASAGEGSAPLVLFVVDAANDQTASVEPAESDETSARQITQLKSELLQTRESLQASIEELQTSNEEQQSTNEELVAANEEMQSTNEELLSVNEELSTVNLEYQKSNRQLEVMASDLENLFTSTKIGTIFLDNELHIRKFTPTVCGIIKLVEHDIGRSIDHFKQHLPPDLPALINDVVETGVPLEEEFRGPDERWYLVRVLPYVGSDHSRTGVVLTFVDVAALKNAEETMRMMNDGLASANRMLSEQREELEDLFSIVAHDLKRPVLSLDGLLKLAVDATDEERNERLGRSLDEVARMRRMLVDLEQMSAVTRRQVNYATVDVKAWLTKLVDRFQDRATEKGVRLNCMCDQRTAHLPLAAVEEIAINLIENAIKYGSTGEGPQIDISCEIIGRHFRLAVRDNGKGIAPHNHDKIFEPFRRLDSDLAEGSGIGLVAVRRMLNRVGGSVEVDSDVGKGAKFAVSVPVEGPPVERGALRVLLVEDDPLDVKITLRYLGTEHKTSVVRSLSEAIERVEKESFDLILLDLSLEDGHGFRLVARLNELHLDTPVVVLSGQAEGIAQEAMLTSVSGFIEKGELTSEVLHKRVAEAIDHFEAGAAATTV